MSIKTKNIPLRHQSQTPSSRKGHEFEDYIITLFNKDKFQLLHWRSDKVASNGSCPQSNSFPDLEFAFKGNKKHRFAVECKWRYRFNDNKIIWAKSYQISIYQQFQNENGIPVFIAIGVGGEPSNPQRLFVTPLDNIYIFPEVLESQLIPYKRRPGNRFFYDTIQLKLF